MECIHDKRRCAIRISCGNSKRIATKPLLKLAFRRFRGNSSVRWWGAEAALGWQLRVSPAGSIGGHCWPSPAACRRRVARHAACPGPGRGPERSESSGGWLAVVQTSDQAFAGDSLWRSAVAPARSGALSLADQGLRFLCQPPAGVLASAGCGGLRQAVCGCCLKRGVARERTGPGRERAGRFLVRSLRCW